jgi:ferrous iron transport protein B
VGAVLGFLPQMAVLFLLMSILEDCGYMARVAFMLDRLFRAIGLSGKSVIPLMVSMGCGVPGVMATRTIENEKDRRMTIMLTTFVPCGAKLPILALVGAMIGQTATVATIAYFTGFGSVILGGMMLRKMHMFAGGYNPFVMEMPAYHMPQGANINLRAMERCKSFAQKAGTVIFLASALIWTLSNYTWKFEYLNTAENKAAVEHSMLAETGNLFAPLFTPLGWGDWKPAVATVTGLVAKENVVGTFGVLYAAHDSAESTAEEEEDALPRSGDWLKANALSALTLAIWQSDADTRQAAPVEAPAGDIPEQEPAETGDKTILESALSVMTKPPEWRAMCGPPVPSPRLARAPSCSSTSCAPPALQPVVPSAAR